MRYAQIREMDISNGEGVGVSLFVQGCDIHCKGCFNQETWDFDGGKEWTEDIERQFMSLVARPYITRVSILGGEPLHPKNVHEVISIATKIKNNYADKEIWLYSGYTWRTILDSPQMIEQRKLLEICDVLVDGRYDESLRDISLRFRGSSNQNIINLQPIA